MTTGLVGWKGNLSMRIIDIHTHGIGGYSTESTRADDILAMARIQGTCGVTDIIPTLYPGTPETMRSQLYAVRCAMDAQQNGTYPFSAARILGAALEGPFLSPAYAGALDGSSFHAPSQKILETLIDGYEDMVMIIVVAPELSGAIPLIRSIADRGIKVHMGHTGATFNEAESAFHAGATGITHIFNAMRGFHHREPGIIGFGLTNPHIFVEIISDGFHLHDETVRLIFSSKKTERVFLVSDSVAKTAPTCRGASITAPNRKLTGGSCTVAEAAKRLRELGYNNGTIETCTGKNQLAYFGI